MSRDSRHASVLGAAALLGVVGAIVDVVVIGGGYRFLFPTARDVRLFSMVAVASEVVVAAVLAGAACAILGVAAGWPLACFLFLSLVGWVHVAYNIPATVGTAGGPAAALALATILAALLSFVLRSLPERMPRVGRVRPALFLLLLCMGYLAIHSAPLPAVRAAGPSVLFVVIDTLRADKLGFAGSPDVWTPELDRTSRRGVVMERAIAASNSTPAAIASLLSAEPVSHHGVRGFHYVLDEATATVPESFLRSGYRTFGFSSSFPAHLAYHRFDRGLEYRDDTTVARPVRLCPPVEALERLPPFRATTEWGLRLLPRSALPSTRQANTTTDAVLHFLESDGAHPFFGFVHYFDPHAPYSPPRAYSRYALGIADMQRGRLDARFAAARQEKPDWLARPVDVRDETFPVMSYDGEVGFVDHEIGRLLRELGRRGVGAGTIVAVTADHGENLLEHGQRMLFNHDGLFETQIRVPMVIAGPGVPEGRLVAVPARSIDLAPTLLELAGLPDLPGAEGRSLVPLWRDHEQAPRAAVTEEPHGRGAALNSGPYKLLRYEGREQVYDTERDPGEERDLGSDRPDLVADLGRQLDRSMGSLAADPGQRELDAETKQSLRTLGYLHDGDATESGDAAPSPAGAGPGLLVIAVDGMGHEQLARLSAAGRMPFLARLADHGGLAVLRSSQPMISPRSWNTIATGTSVGQHGITGFDLLVPGSYEIVPGDAELRLEPAFWDRLGSDGMPVLVVNWPTTYPALPVGGALVSGDFIARWRPAPRATYPGGLGEGMIREVDGSDALRAEATTVLAGGLPAGADEARLVSGYVESDRRAALIAATLARRLRPRLAAVYFGGIDGEGRAGWDGMDGGSRVAAYYEYVDRLCETVAAAMAEGSRVIVISDHGLRLASGDEVPELDANAVLERLGYARRTKDGHLDFAKTRLFNLEERGATEIPIYANVAGREPQGQVAEADRPALIEDAARRLVSLRTLRGTPVFARVAPWEGRLSDAVARPELVLTLDASLRRGDRVNFERGPVAVDRLCFARLVGGAVPDDRGVLVGAGPEERGLADVAPLVVELVRERMAADVR